MRIKSMASFRSAAPLVLLLLSSCVTGGWKKVTSAVHNKGGKIFMQIMHTGRVSHPLNMPENARILAPSAEKLEGNMWTDQKELQPYPAPEEMTAEDIQNAIDEFVKGAKNAVEAGFNGIELHGANGYLIEQFISPVTNKRSDEYGGSIENRIRFVLEIAQKTSDAIGGNKTGIRVSPYGASNGMKFYDEIEETYAVLSKKLSEIGIVYIHIADHSSMGAPGHLFVGQIVLHSDQIFLELLCLFHQIAYVHEEIPRRVRFCSCYPPKA